MSDFVITSMTFEFPQQEYEYKYQDYLTLVKALKLEYDEDCFFKLIDGKEIIYKKIVSVLIPLRSLD